MNLGGSPKQLRLLGGLVVVMLVVVYYEFFSGPSEPQYSTTPAAAAAAAAIPPPIRGRQMKTETRRTVARVAPGDWKPRLGAKNPEDRPDPASVDPTLNLSLLARVQAMNPLAAGRNLFVFGTAPAPVAKLDLPKTPKIAINQPPPAPPQPVVNPGPPPPPQAPPMAFKYYGYKVSKSDGHKAAFLLDGDDILIAGENDVFKRRYRVVKIGVSSIVIEDTQFKSTQTLPLQENSVV
ncbi:MAG: hypothetical protein ABJC09_05630 [Terriglobia bacterium]